MKPQTAKKPKASKKDKTPKAAKTKVIVERGKKFSNPVFRQWVRYADTHPGFPERVARAMEKLDPGHKYYRQEVKSWLNEDTKQQKHRVEPRYGIGRCLLTACERVEAKDAKDEQGKRERNGGRVRKRKPAKNSELPLDPDPRPKTNYNERQWAE